MSNQKFCPNGHAYDADRYEQCPYCPTGDSGTQTAGGTSATKTQVLGPGGGGDSTQVVGGGGGAPGSKTQIGAPSGGAPGASAPTRRLVGWLVSFDVDPNGADFQIYEGRNSIGSDPGCDIVVQTDGELSSHHATILFRQMDQIPMRFKDEMSTNGSFVNEEFTTEGGLNDGDILRLGNTQFLLRTIPKTFLK